MFYTVFKGLPGGAVVNANAGDLVLILELRKIPWRRKWHGQRNLAGYSPWDHGRVRHRLATKQQR